MVPIIPSDILAGSWELVCYGLTVLAAAFSYLLMLR
jgi:hypothetical protein